MIKEILWGKTRNPHIQFFRYLFVGGSSAVLDISVYTLCANYLDMNYQISNVIAFIFGFTWNYLTSIIWIFESRHQRAAEFFLVLAIAITGLILTAALLHAFIEWLEFTKFWAKFAATWIVLFWNFSARKIFVFH